MMIGRDKLLHAGVCLVIDVVLAVVGLWTPFLRVLFVGGVIGGAKEIYDYLNPEAHDADWQDIVADFVGAIIGEVAFAIVTGAI